LSRQLAASPEKFKILESIVHPLVRKKEAEFLASARASGASLVVLDIPLLFETDGEGRVDTIVVVTCSPELQKQRVMQRDGMTEEKFNLILARQVADSVKRAKADYIIDTGHGLDAARKSVDRLISELRRTDQDTDRHA
jgi:dephospho-CoA kinase